MILYHKVFDPNFSQYGIEIPILDDRPQQVYNYILKHFGHDYFVKEIKIETLKPEDLLLVHSEDYVRQLFNTPDQAIVAAFELIDQNGNYNRYNPQKAQLPLIKLRDSILIQAYGTYQSMKIALEKNFCFFLGGGMHHAMSFGGRGFCLINDVVIGIRKLQAEKKVKRAWIIDIDAHKGDGAAEICKDDPTINTFSIHMKDGWPLDDHNQNSPWFIPNDLDVEISENEQGKYLERLEQGLQEFCEKYYSSDLDLVVVIDGADPHEDDWIESASKLKLSYQVLLNRDLMVDKYISQFNVPICYTIAGGYGPNAWRVYANFLESVIKSGRILKD